MPSRFGPLRGKLTGHYYMERKEIAFQIEFYRGAFGEFAFGLARSDPFMKNLAESLKGAVSEDSAKIPPS